MNRKIKKALSILLCMLLAMSVFTLTGFAIAGSGTKTSPYVISTQADLTELAEKVNAGESYKGKYFVLAADIEVSSFTPIGSKETPFSGVFDGNGFTISGIAYNNSSSVYVGLFGYVDGAVIKNVCIDSSSFRGKDYVGAVVGFAKNSSIDNCTVTAVVRGANYIGGIAGFADGTNITNCLVTGTASYYLLSTTKYLGGIAGKSNAEISGCQNDLRISGKSTLGGIVGETTGSIIACVNNGTLNATDVNCGGIAGSNVGGAISYSYNSGAVSAESTSDCVGGIAGLTENGSISNCYNEGNISASTKYSAGIFGYGLFTAVTNCYNAGTASYGIGGMSGCTNENVYYLSSASNGAFYSISGKNTNCVALTSAQMKTASSFSGFDFSNDWELAGLHSSYPTLRAIDYHTWIYVESVAPTCTKKGYDAYVCSVCGKTDTTDTLDVVEHALSVFSTTPATCIEAGEKIYKCGNCSFVKSVEIEAVGHIDDNKDGVCDDCLADVPLEGSSSSSSNSALSFWDKIVQAFKAFFDWLGSLFS